MNRQEFLLVTAADDAASMAQRICKALQFGLDEVQPDQDYSNADRLVQEYLKLRETMEMLFREGLELPPGWPLIVKKKHASIEGGALYAQASGVLDV